MKDKLNINEKVNGDPFLCHCTPCCQFWDKTFGDSMTALQQPAEVRSQNTSIMNSPEQRKEKHPAVVKVGERVLVKGKYKGTVKFVGPLDPEAVAPPTFVGVHLDERAADTDNTGLHKGKRYFHCPPGHGMMVKYGQVVKLPPPAKHPPLNGNPMFPSYSEIKERRKQRSAIDPSLEIGKPYSGTSKPVPVQANITDKKDVAVKDAKRYENQQKRAKSQPRPTTSASKASLPSKEPSPREDIRKWKERFGGDKRAELMAQTLHKLQLAYKKGLDYKKEEQEGKVHKTRDSDPDDADDELDDDESGHFYEPRRRGR